MNDIIYNYNKDVSTRAIVKILASGMSSKSTIPEIKDVIFNDPATIVFWADGTKTVVKAQDEAFDPEKGLAMAIVKKIFGNKGSYCNRIKKWTEKYKKPEPADSKEKITPKIVATDVRPWKIWVEYYKDGEQYAAAVLPREYASKSSARRAAHRQYNNRTDVVWIISQTNPWAEENSNG